MKAQERAKEVVLVLNRLGLETDIDLRAVAVVLGHILGAQREAIEEYQARISGYGERNHYMVFFGYEACNRLVGVGNTLLDECR